MKIGIITLWGCSNYGQNLQVYALQRFLRDAGHDAFLIRYPLIEYHDESPAKWLKLFLKNTIPPILLYLIYRIKGKKINISSIKKKSVSFKKKFSFYRDPSYLIHLRSIGQFLDAYVNQSELFYPSIKDIKSFPPDAGAYITGSDQVWNFWGQPLTVAKHETADAFFLNFGKAETKRIAYAASFGTRTVDKKSAKIIRPLIGKFSYVSVREESGLEFCKSCGYNDAEWVPDPVLLLDKNHYRSLYKDSKTAKQEPPFCLVYMIRDNQHFLQKLYSWAKQKNYAVCLITNSGLVQHAYRETFATIPQWLNLIDNAEYVITDSYHGSVFSVIFGKSFGIIPFPGCEADIRLNDLFKRFKLRFPLLDDTFVSFTTNEEINAASVILDEIYAKYTFDWFNKILSLPK